MGNGTTTEDKGAAEGTSSTTAPNPKLQQLLAMLGPLLKQMGGPQGQPQGAGSPVISPERVPQIKYDPSAATGRMPMPVPAPTKQGYESPANSGQFMSQLDPRGSAAFMAVQGVSQLLQNYNQRKDQKEQTEAANIAQNLMQAMEKNDVATVHEILNDKNSTKILNKVYKGWLTKSKEAQKPQEESDPHVSGFEAGLKQYVEGKQQQPQMPKTMGGYALPQSSQAEQLGAAKTSAEAQAAQKDPRRMLSSQLSSDEMRQAELAKSGLAPTPKSESELATAQAKIETAAASVKKAQLEVQKAEAELALKKQEASSAEAKEKVSADIEHQKYLKALVDLDISREKLKTAIIAKQMKGNTKPITAANKLKLESVNKAMLYIEGIQKDKRGFTASDITEISTDLKAAGSTELLKYLPKTLLGFTYGGSNVDAVASAIKSYKDSLEKAFAPEEKAPAKKDSAGAADAGDDSGDEVDADIVVNPEDMEEPKKP